MSGGTVEFSAADICILDSPLLQRLKRIKQLGLASTDYCNADNSRFSHTIGVTEVALHELISVMIVNLPEAMKLFQRTVKD